MMKIKQRTPFFFAVEGDSEQSLVRWYQSLCDQQGLHLHLDSQNLHGGGYKSMFETAVLLQERKDVKQSFLLVDSDRSLNQRRDDPWSLDDLKRKAHKKDIFVCAHRPNIEGFFLRLFSGNEHLKPLPKEAEKRLRKKEWPDYEKPENAKRIGEKFTLEDLLRLAKVDSDLDALLLILGLKK
jgi:hypothetical protein